MDSITLKQQRPRSRPFTLVLSGGGARGLTHVGVLRGLEHYGLVPQAIVGVSMGAIVASVYTLNTAWYDEILAVDLHPFSFSLRPRPCRLTACLHTLLTLPRRVVDVFTSWGPGSRTVTLQHALLRQLTHNKRLEEARPPLLITSLDLLTGNRIALTTGSAADAAYASAAVPGLFPPLENHGRLLVDIGLFDNAPIELARQHFGGPIVAVDATQQRQGVVVRNGFEAFHQALQVALAHTTTQQLDKADLVLKPQLPRIGLLEFQYRRHLVAAGLRAVRSELPRLKRLLVPADPTPLRSGTVDAPVHTMPIPETRM